MYTILVVQRPKFFSFFRLISTQVPFFILKKGDSLFRKDLHRKGNQVNKSNTKVRLKSGEKSYQNVYIRILRSNY